MMDFSSVRAVLFDLDGTLVDSAPDIARAVDRTLRVLGRPPAGEDKVRNWVGNGAPRLIKRALTGEMYGEPEAELYERAFDLFFRHYGEDLTSHSVLYPGAAELLAVLRQRGLKLACVTNKPERFARPVLKALGIAEPFEVIVGGDTVDTKKPDPAPMLFTLDRLGVAPEHALMVGDSVIDVEAARNTGTGVVCVPYGYNHGVDVRGFGPDAVIDNLRDLERMLP